jgi:hypothetical protein
MTAVEGSPIMMVFATVTKGLLEECEGRSVMVYVTSYRYVVLDKLRLFFGNVTLKKLVTFYVLCIPLQVTECCHAHV